MAFCLSQINLSERGLKKLQDNFSCYQSLLSDIEVYNTFIQIINRAKKFAKPEMKVRKRRQYSLVFICIVFQAVIEEFEVRLTEVHCKGLEQQRGSNDLGGGEKNDFEEQSSATQVPTITNQVPATPQSKFLLVVVHCHYNSKLRYDIYNVQQIVSLDDKMAFFFISCAEINS